MDTSKTWRKMKKISSYLAYFSRNPWKPPRARGVSGGSLANFRRDIIAGPLGIQRLNNYISIWFLLENTGDENNPADSNQEIRELDNLLAPLPSQMELPFTCHHCGVGCSHKGKQTRLKRLLYSKNEQITTFKILPMYVTFKS